MKQKKCCRLLAGILLAGVLSTTVQAASPTFSDVPPSAWCYGAVEHVASKGWMAGTGPDSFSPDASLTRAMLSVILWRMEGGAAADSTAAFSDTEPGAWYASGLNWSVEHGLFSGYPDGTFRPNEPITREQLAVVFYQRAGGPATGNGGGTVPVKNGCAWAEDACAWANESGRFTDALGTLDLCAPASRAEIAYWLNADLTEQSVPTLTEGRFQSMNYLLYAPTDTAPGMPLIVYLHGGHSKGDDLSLLTDTDGFPQYLADGLLGDVPAYVLIPQLPADQSGWKAADETLMGLIDKVCTETGADRSRISLTGHSMGGTGTWDLALLHPDVFRRIAPMSGSIRTTSETLSALSGMPVWTFVGENDKVVKPNATEQFIAALSRQDQNARMTVFQNTDHAGVAQRAWLENGQTLLNWLTQK